MEHNGTHGGQTMVVVAGIDVSKATLEVQFLKVLGENNATGIRRLNLERQV